MAVFNLGGKDVHVNAWQTPWPLSVVYKQQGIEVTVNPERHWWCLWLCQTTDDVDVIDCAADLISTFAANSGIASKCENCGDLVLRSAATVGFSAPWLYDRADFSGGITFDGSRFEFKGSLHY
jgi:hypothetical protein